MSARKSFFKMISKGVLDKIGPPRTARDPRAEDLTIPGVPSHLAVLSSDVGSVSLSDAAEAQKK